MNQQPKQNEKERVLMKIDKDRNEAEPRYEVSFKLVVRSVSSETGRPRGLDGVDLARAVQRFRVLKPKITRQ